MRAVSIFIATLFFFIPAVSSAQDIAEPFKVGTFEIYGAPKVAIVLRNSLIIELSAAEPKSTSIAATRPPPFLRQSVCAITDFRLSANTVLV